MFRTVHREIETIQHPTIHGVPCLWAEGTSLSEVLPDETAGITPWDAEASADRALELLRDLGARDRNVAAIRTAAVKLTWDAAAVRSRLSGVSQYPQRRLQPAMRRNTCRRPANTPSP